MCKIPERLDLISRIEKFVTNFDTAKNNAIFEKWIITCCHISGLIIIGICAGCLLVLIYLLIYYAIVGEKILHYGFELPFVDWYKWLGYSLNLLYVTILVYTYSLAIIASVIVISFYLIMSFGRFELLKFLLEQLDELIVGNKNGENDDKIKDSIRKIAQMHHELDEYVE